MFVLCKDVKIYNYESHFHFGSNPHFPISKNLQTLSKDLFRSPGSKIKGLTMSRTLVGTSNSNINLQGKVSKALSKEISLQQTQRKSASNSRRIHSISCKNKKSMLGQSKHSKKTTNLTSSKEVQTDFAGQHSLQNCNPDLQGFKQQLLQQHTLSTTLAVTKRFFTGTSKTNLRRATFDPLNPENPLIESLQSYEYENDEQNHHNLIQNQYRSSLSESSQKSTPKRKVTESQGSRFYNINIMSERVSARTTSSSSSNLIDPFTFTRNHDWEGFKQKMDCCQLKRVVSRERIESVENTLNDSANFVIEQSIIQSHNTKTKFQPINSQEFTKDFTENLALVNEIGFAVSLKCFRQDAIDAINRQLRNYETIGSHSNILFLYQHSVDHQEHILIKQAYSNRLGAGNSDRLNSYITFNRIKHIEIKKILECTENALASLQQRGIFMREINFCDLRECFGTYKLCNLDESATEMQEIIPISDNISRLRNLLEKSWV